MNSTRVLVRTRLLLIGLFLGALACGTAQAQEVTGAIQGTVASAAGSPEPHVVLTLSGPNLQGTRGTSTDVRGFYQFLAVPPGLYDLHVSRVGLQPMEVQQILVELGRTTAVPTLTMNAQPITMEQVVVQAPRVTLDPAHTGAGGTLRTSEYASLPVDRDYKSIIAILPQANTSYRGDPVNVAGSTGLENQYYIDGVNVTDTKNAARATSLPYNFVRSVEVKTGGYEAQYGRALGAVVNALTYSGSNDFQASVFGFTQPSRWAMDAREASGISEGSAVSYDWGARASGPVMKDRLWYSAAVNPRTDRADKTITGFGSYPDRTKAVRFATKLTWKANEATNLELSVFGDPTTRDQVYGLLNGLNSVQNPDALLARVESGGTTASLHGSVTASPSLLLQGSVSGQWDRWLDEGATERGRSEPVYNDWVEGFASGGRGWRMEDDRGRLSLARPGDLPQAGPHGRRRPGVRGRQGHEQPAVRKHQSPGRLALASQPRGVQRKLPQPLPGRVLAGQLAGHRSLHPEPGPALVRAVPVRSERPHGPEHSRRVAAPGGLQLAAGAGEQAAGFRLVRSVLPDPAHEHRDHVLR